MNFYQRQLLKNLVIINLLMVSLPGWTRPTPDSTLGSEASEVIDHSARDFEIGGGARRGRNLFQSFQEFGVDEGGSVYFLAPNGVENIFSRITGANHSEILGVLGVRGNANLFLMNPNGVLFGSNASLDVQSSFIGTTADAMQFGEQGFFSATNPEMPSQLLSINPSAFLFNQVSTSSLINRSIASTGETTPSGSPIVGLQVPDGQSLLFVGGDISNIGGQLSALGGHIELGGLAQSGRVMLNMTDDIFTLIFPNNVRLSNITLADDSRVLVRGSGSGSIVVNASTLTATNGGRLVAGVEGFGEGSSITVNTENLNISGVGNSQFGSGLFIQVLPDASGSSGNISINTQFLTASSGAVLVNEVTERASRNGGNIIINTNYLSVTGGAQIITSTYGEGDAGDVLIHAREEALFQGSDSAAFSTVEQTGIGRAGRLEIITKALYVNGGAQLTAGTRGQGDAGSVLIHGRESISLNGVGRNGRSSAILANTTRSAHGRGGRISIRTPLISIDNGAVINARTANTNRGGNIEVNADTINLRSGGQIITSALRTGRAGSIALNANEISISGRDPTFNQRLRQFPRNVTANEGRGESGLFTSTRSRSTRNGGSIQINSHNFILRDGSHISAQSLGSGRAGDINITATGTLNTSNSDITTTATRSSGGDIVFTGGNIRLRGDSAIRTNSRINGGNITVNAGSLIAYSDSDIIAAAGTRGGNINFGNTIAFFNNYRSTAADADPATLENNNSADINATGTTPGTISVPDTSFIQNSFADFPTNAVNTDQLIANSCIARRADGSTFLVTGTGSLPERPGSAEQSKYPTGEVRAIPRAESHRWQQGDSIVEPQGVYRLPNGRIILSRECKQAQ